MRFTASASVIHTKRSVEFGREQRACHECIQKVLLRFRSITNVMAIRTLLIPDSTSSVNLIHSRCPEPCATFTYIALL